MSKAALTQVVQRSINDPAFRRQIAADPTALRGYDLTAEESGALRNRDAAKLTAFGIDQRMSKMFLDPGMGTGASATLTGGEPRDVAPVWIGDGSSSTEAATGSEPRDVAPVWIGDGSSSTEAATGSEPRDVAPVWIGDGSQTLPVHTYSGDDNAGPVTEAATGTEPRDVAPTWIGEGSPSSEGYATDEGQLTNDVQGDGDVPTGDGDLQQ
jgi:hypothetical protein